MRKWSAALMLFGLLGASWAGAQSSATVHEGDGTTVAPLKELIGDKKFAEDHRITDLELRAQAGSLSRYSVKAELGYSGSPIDNLGAANKPNPDQRPGDNRTLLSGLVGLRYRLTSDDALNFTTGVSWFTPYQAVTGVPVERKPGSKNYDIANPGASYDHTYAVGATQMRSSLRGSITTAEAYKRVGQWAAVGLAQAVKYTPGHGRLILGAQVTADYFAYDRKYQSFVNKSQSGDGNVSKYYLNLIPSVEYKLTSNLNFNTSLGYPYQNLRADGSWWRWTHQLSTWRVGVGWAITHDVYLNPYVNFFAESPAFATASLNFNTVFSLF